MPRQTRARAAAALCAACVLLPGRASGGQDPIIGPQVRIDPLGGTAAANETTAASSAPFPLEVVAAWNDWRESIPNNEIIRMGVSVSLDGGATWSDFLLRPPAIHQSNVEGDPMTAWDERTGTLWAGAISFTGNGGVFVARKDPGSASFGQSVMADATSSADKGWMAAGPLPGLPATTRLYVAYNLGLIWSDDLGATFTNPVSLGAGLGFLPRVGPGGELYVAYWDWTGAGDHMRLSRSLDGAQSFTTHVIALRMDVWGIETFNTRFPGTFRVPPLVSLAVDPISGTLYALYPDTTEVIGPNYNVDLYFTKSQDQGTTWTTPVVINGDANPPGDQFFPWVEVDRDGRVHVVYLDSRHTVQNDNTVHGMFDAYYAHSADGGSTWSEVRLTPASWDSDRDGLDRPAQFIGDYLGMALAGRRVYPIYPDTSAGDPDTYTNVIVFPGDPDLDGDGLVGIADLLALLAAWGVCPDCAGCPADLEGDCAVGIGDLLVLLGSWG
jgi:hypothetical protein